jgi:hypothetical protein
MTAIRQVTLEVADPTAAGSFNGEAFGLGDTVGVRASQAPTAGFRGFTLSLVVSQPSTVDSLVGTALRGGATTLKPVKKSFWGYGGVVQAPDGTIWKVATSRRFYEEHGLAVAKSVGSKYVEFDTAGSPVKLALYNRRAAAKDAGVEQDGTGSHRIVIGGDAGPFTDPDGFVWEAPSA